MVIGPDRLLEIEAQLRKGTSVIARSASDEAIHTCFAALWIVSLRSQ
jgi:hypothetical protein